MKKYIYIGVAYLLVALLGIVTLQSGRIKKFKQELIKTNATIEAYSNENSVLKKNNKTFMLTIDELNSLNDSLIVKINDVRKELNIKDKEIARLAYLASLASIKDTIRLKDTIFVKNTKVDTTVNNKWYTIGLRLEYPHMVGLNIKVPSEKYIVSSYKKVLLNPSDCKVRNWFKKKSKIVEVEVVEKNPFIINEKQKFIEVIK